MIWLFTYTILEIGFAFFDEKLGYETTYITYITATILTIAHERNLGGKSE
jgi:hypothetical protein